MHIEHERAAEGYPIILFALSEFTSSKLTRSSQKTALSSPLTAQSPLITVFKQALHNCFNQISLSKNLPSWRNHSLSNHQPRKVGHGSKDSQPEDARTL